MHPVTPADVARLADGTVNDPAEADRIFDAIHQNPALERLFTLLTSDLENDSPSTDSSTRLQEFLKWQQWLAQARLCRIEGSLPAIGKSRTVNRRLFWKHNSPPAECRFEPASDQTGLCRVHVPLPPHCKVLSLVAADFVWGRIHDLTRIRLHADWNPRTADTTTTAPVTASAPRPARESATTITTHAAQPLTPLAAETLAASTPQNLSPAEYQGDGFSLTVAQMPARTVRVIATQQPAFPLPVLLTARDEDGTVLDSEIRLLHNETQELENLFKDCSSPVAWLELTPVLNTETDQLTPRQATELIAAVKYAIRSMEPVPDKPGEYTVQLGDTEMQTRLASTNLILALQIAETEGKVQP